MPSLYWRLEGLEGVDLLRADASTHRYARHCHAAMAAAAAGFADQSHLIRKFKAAYGVTPGQYLKTLQ